MCVHLLILFKISLYVLNVSDVIYIVENNLKVLLPLPKIKS